MTDVDGPEQAGGDDSVPASSPREVAPGDAQRTVVLLVLRPPGQVWGNARMLGIYADENAARARVPGDAEWVSERQATNALGEWFLEVRRVES